MKFSVVDGRIFNPGDLSWEGFRALAEVSVINFEVEPPLAAVIDWLKPPPTETFFSRSTASLSFFG